MKTTYMTRADEVGSGPFDSIKWAFEVHVKQPDTGEFNFAVLTGRHDDSPAKIEFWRDEPNYDTPPDYVWTSGE